MESKIEIKEALGTKPKGFMAPLYVGYEFEFNPKSREHAATITRYMKDKFGMDFGEKTNGLKRQRIVQAGIEVSLIENKYEKPGLVSDFYRDGSVEMEVVTRPLLTEKIGILKESIFDPIIENGDCWAGGKGGLHMTFLTDHHKELSTFNPVWVKNILQLSRIFYPALIMWNFDPQKRSTRSVHYRKIIPKETIENLGASNHYDCISLRVDHGQVWGIEVRFPDGTNSWAVVEKYAVFWKALFNLAWDISQKGVLNFSQDIWDYNMNFYNQHRGTEANIRQTKTNLKLILTKLLSPYMTESKVRTHYEGWLAWQNKCFAEKGMGGM
jgi:hypothetical protein